MEPFCRRLHSCLQPQQIEAQSILNYWNNPWKDLPNKPLYFNKLRARARCHSTAGSWRFVKLVFGNQPMILIQVDHVLCTTLPEYINRLFNSNKSLSAFWCRIVAIAWAANSQQRFTFSTQITRYVIKWTTSIVSIMNRLKGKGLTFTFIKINTRRNRIRLRLFLKRKQSFCNKTDNARTYVGYI